MCVSLPGKDEKCDLLMGVKCGIEGDVSEEERIGNPTGNTDRCHTSPSLAGAALLQRLQKWVLTVWRAVNYKIYGIIFHIR